MRVRSVLFSAANDNGLFSVNGYVQLQQWEMNNYSDVSVPSTFEVFDQRAFVYNITAPLVSRMIKHSGGSVTRRK